MAELIPVVKERLVLRQLALFFVVLLLALASVVRGLVKFARKADHATLFFRQELTLVYRVELLLAGLKYLCVLLLCLLLLNESVLLLFYCELLLLQVVLEDGVLATLLLQDQVVCEDFAPKHRLLFVHRNSFLAIERTHVGLVRFHLVEVGMGREVAYYVLVFEIILVIHPGVLVFLNLLLLFVSAAPQKDAVALILLFV